MSVDRLQNMGASPPEQPLEVTPEIESALHRALTDSAAIAALPTPQSDIAMLVEALNAIIDRAPERDAKWAGMTARDIAIYALDRTAIKEPRR